jgi:hypothetical protein
VAVLDHLLDQAHKTAATAEQVLSFFDTQQLEVLLLVQD